MLLLAMLSLGAYGQEPQPAEHPSLRLEEGMPEDLVLYRIGAPTSTSLMTCGASTKSPWDCKIWSYKHLELDVYFRRTAAGKWVINSWRSY